MGGTDWSISCKACSKIAKKYLLHIQQNRPRFATDCLIETQASGVATYRATVSQIQEDAEETAALSLVLPFG